MASSSEYGSLVAQLMGDSIRMLKEQPMQEIVLVVELGFPSESEMKEQEGDFSVLNKIRENELLDIFCTLVQIPSPSKKEEKVIAWIKDFAKQNEINCNN